MAKRSFEIKSAVWRWLYMCERPEPWNEIYQARETIDMASSIDRLFLLHPLTVRDVGYPDKKYQILVGKTRYAALIRLNRRRTIMNVVKCNDETAQAIRATAFAKRRHTDRPSKEALQEEIRALLSLYPEDEVYEAREDGDDVSLKAQARRNAAMWRGIHPRFLTGTDARPEPAPDEPVETMGLKHDPEFVDQIQQHRNRVNWIRKNLRQVSRHLGSLRGTLPDAVITRAQKEARASVQRVLESVPHTICPYCKGTEGVFQDCSHCDGYGWVTSDAFKQAPAELTDSENPKIMVDGQLVEVSDD